METEIFLFAAKLPKYLLKSQTPRRCFDEADARSANEFNSVNTNIQSMQA